MEIKLLKLEDYEFFEEVYSEPDVTLGEWEIFGESNSYDDLIDDVSLLKYKHDCIVAVPSGYKMRIVDDIYEHWALKEGLSGTLLTGKDYSNNPNCSKAWHVSTSDFDLFYELSDVLKKR